MVKIEEEQIQGELRQELQREGLSFEQADETAYFISLLKKETRQEALGILSLIREKI